MTTQPANAIPTAKDAKPHAETAEEVAERVLVEYGMHFGGKPYGHLVLKAIITAAIKRERGEA